MGSHDSGYKLLFSHPYLVECLIRGFVPGPWIDQLDFSSLEPVREAHPRDEIGVRYDDMIWRLRWRDSGEWIYVYLLIEFQSADEPFMAVRVLDYDGGLYRQLVRALKLKRGDKLPIVFPLVLYRGAKTWQAATDVFDLIAPAPAEIAPYLPHLRYLLLDANAYPAAQLEQMRNPAACSRAAVSSRRGRSTSSPHC
jgi:Putative transposase, YhgA-like